MTDSNLIFYILSFALALLFTVAAEKRLIPILRSRAAQPIYTEGPDWHLSKQGTPTMGGIGFIFAISISLLGAILYLYSSGESYYATSLSVTLLYAVSNSLIGIIDDSAKIRKKENAGLTPLQKLLRGIYARFHRFGAKGGGERSQRVYRLGGDHVIQLRLGIFIYEVFRIRKVLRYGAKEKSEKREHEAVQIL